MRLRGILFICLFFHAGRLCAQHLVLDQGFQSRYDFNSNVGEIYGVTPIGNSDIILYGDFNDPSFNIRFSNFLKLNKFGQLDFSWAYTNRGPGDVVDNIWSTHDGGFIIDIGWGYFARIDSMCHITNQSWTYNVNHINLNLLAVDDNFAAYPMLASGWPGNWTPSYMNAIFKIDSLGNYDTTFVHHIVGTAGYISTCKNGDKLLSGAYMKAYDGHYSNDVIRIDSTGNVDTSFTCNIQLSTFSQVRRVYEQPDGRIMAIGIFENNQGQAISIARLLPNGKVDTTFSTHVNATYNYTNNTQISDIAPYKYGYIIVGGFSEINGIHRGGIAVLDSIGNLDTTEFNGQGFVSINNPPFTSAGVNGIFYDSRLDKYYLCGMFDHFNGISVQPIIRLKKTITGLEEEDAIQSIPDIGIQPNPSSENIVHLTSKFPLKGISKMRFFNVAGECELEEIVDLSNPMQEISIEKISSGFYIVEMQNGEKIFSTKFIKLN